MYRQLPNALTIARLILAGVFFVVLNQYRYTPGHVAVPGWWLILAIVIFLLAISTDWLDGYLARRWKAESTFGRIMDPFCDKVLIIGAFIYLAGPRFVDPTVIEGATSHRFGLLPGNMITGFYPWMVALMLARELLVTGIRGEIESMGVKFGANIWGKLKTTFQATVIPVILLIVLLDPNKDGQQWMAHVRLVLVYATVFVTVASGVPYITGAMRVMKTSGVAKTDANAPADEPPTSDDSK